MLAQNWQIALAAFSWACQSVYWCCWSGWRSGNGSANGQALTRHGHNATLSPPPEGANNYDIAKFLHVTIKSLTATSSAHFISPVRGEKVPSSNPFLKTSEGDTAIFAACLRAANKAGLASRLLASQATAAHAQASLASFCFPEQTALHRAWLKQLELTCCQQGNIHQEHILVKRNCTSFAGLALR